MAETAGYEGMIYYRHGYFKGTATFAHNSPAADTITASSLSSAGFLASDTINVAGTSSNSGSYTITSVSASVMTLIASDTLTAEASNASTILDAKPGKALAGFYNWTINYAGEAHEVTDFANAGTRAYIAGGTGWTGTATKRYSSASSLAKSSWVGGTVHRVRFFLRSRAIPTAANKASYLEGSAYVTTVDTTTPVGGVIEQAVNFQGTGALTLVKRQTTWDTGS